MGVSENSGTPKSSILIGFSIINHPFWVSLFLETPKSTLSWIWVTEKNVGKVSSMRGTYHLCYFSLAEEQACLGGEGSTQRLGSWKQ